MTSAVNATSGPVAPVAHIVSRTMVSAIGSGTYYVNRDSKAPRAFEVTVDSGAGKRAVTTADGTKGGKTAAANPARNAPNPSSAPGSANAVSSAFNFDPETRHVVMQLRDGNGSVVVQIPSEQALRQYEQALKHSQESVAHDAASGASAGESAGAVAEPPQAPAASSGGGAAAGAGAHYNTVV